VISKNLVLSERDFNDFQNFCREKGFDLSYFSSEISGSAKEIEQLQFSEPQQ